MSLPLRFAFTALATLALMGCPVEEEPPPEDVLWEPALDDANSGTLDFGTVVIGVDAAQTGRIIATNNSDAIITFTVDCSSMNGGGFLVSACPTEPVEVIPQADAENDFEAEIAVGINFNPTSAAEYQGSVQFVYDNEVVTFLVLGEAVN